MSYVHTHIHTRKRKFFKTINWAIVSVILVALLWSCQKDDETSVASKTLRPQSSTSKSVSASDIPIVMQFLESKSNNRLEFVIDDSNSELGMHRNHEENLSITSVLTDQIKMVTNSYGKSNYTFKLIEEQTKEGTYFLNLVVKEYNDELYMYIIKYVPDASWLSTYIDENSLNNFSGDLYLYNEEGTYVAKVDMVNGSSTLITKDPCDNNTSNSGSSGSNGGGGSGGGSSSSSGTGTGTSSGSSSSSGSSGGGSGGWGIDVDWNMNCCWCEGQVVGTHDHRACAIEITINLAANSDSQNAILGGGRSLRDVLRNPCDDVPEECFDVVGDPCPHGCDADGNCVEDTEEIENTETGIIMEIETPCEKLNNLLTNTTFSEALSNIQQEADGNSERGFEISKDDNGNISTNFVQGGFDEIDLATGGDIIGGIHNHTEDYGQPMFSGQDISMMQFYYLHNQNRPPNGNLVPRDVTSIVVGEYGTYAISINNYFTLTNLLNTVGVKKLKRKLNNAYNRNTGWQGASKYTKALLKTINDLLEENNIQGTPPISLYKLNQDGTAFEEITLDENNEPNAPQPCN